MIDDQIFYYDGTSARPEKVRVLISPNRLEIINLATGQLLDSFSFHDTHINYLGHKFFIYLTKSGTHFIEYPANHPDVNLLKAGTYKHTTGNLKHLTGQRTVVLIAILLALGIGLYLAIVSLVPVIGMRIINKDQEIAIGEKLRTVMLDQESLAGSKINQFATNELQHFADALELSNQYPIKTTVVNSPVVNAYALPGGNIVVHKGILKKIKTPEELVALLSHESTHVNEQHSLRSMLRSAANGLIISVLFGDASGVSGVIATKAETLNGLRYSRSLEAEADRKGMQLMERNKVNINGMKQLMQMLEKEDKMPESLSFLSSHPLTKERVNAANAYIQQHPQNVADRADLAQIFADLKSEL